jgi:hypothetical protein
VSSAPEVGDLLRQLVRERARIVFDRQELESTLQRAIALCELEECVGQPFGACSDKSIS